MLKSEEKYKAIQKEMNETLSFFFYCIFLALKTEDLNDFHFRW